MPAGSVGLASEWRAAAEAAALDEQAGRAHQQVLRLIEDHARRRVGLLPEHVSPRDLQLELVASGRPWPDNPFTGGPLGEGEGPGEVRWSRCEPGRASYRGAGWDGLAAERAWAGGCALASAAHQERP